MQERTVLKGKTSKGVGRIAIGFAGALLVLTSAAAFVANTSPSVPRAAAQSIRGEGSSGLGPLQLPAGANAAGQSQVFYIHGTVSGFAPGVRSTLSLSVQNPLGSPITVNTITIVAGNASSSCPASLLIIPPSWTLNNTYSIGNLSLSVPANSTVAGPSVQVQLASSAGDACSGASFPLMYGGNATG